MASAWVPPVNFTKWTRWFRHTVTFCQVVVASRDFVDRFGALQPFKAREELATLQAAIAEADACVREACVLKIEAMLIHAGKTKLKKTQRDL